MDHELPNGTILAQRYCIKQVIGQGGFGITYLATTLIDNAEVCIKEFYLSGVCTRNTNYSIQSQNLKDISFSEFKEKFITEARELSKFNHAGIVRVSDVFEQFGTAYYVMEYIQGHTLKHYVELNGKLNLLQAQKIISQLLEALKVVHNRGWLHRDIKPDNILIGTDDRVVLIDFGSARTFEQGKTQSHTTILTPGYAPIEQYSNVAKRGQFSDIYSLGATIFFMLTGQKPISVTDRALIKFPEVTSLNSEVEANLNAIILKCLNVAPEERYQTIEALEQDLLQVHYWKTKESEQTNNGPLNWWERNPLISIHIIIVITLLIILSAKINSQSDNTNTPVLSTVDTTTVNTDTAKDIVAGANTDSAVNTDATVNTDSAVNTDSKQVKFKGGNWKDKNINFKSTTYIGTQVWMAKNLDISTFRNGDLIPQAKTAEEWKKAVENQQPAWCYYDNDPANGQKYGKLYNWYAVNDARGLAPQGYHIPTDAEWTTLTTYLGGKEVAGTKMKSTSGWNENGNGTNSSGFNGLPGGYRNDDGTFPAIGYFGEWWSSTENSTNFAWYHNLDYPNGDVTSDYDDKGDGFYVRCLRD